MIYGMRYRCTLAGLAALPFLSSPGLAQNYTWTSSADGDWMGPTNWSLMEVPNSPTARAVIGFFNNPLTISIPSPINTGDFGNGNEHTSINLFGGNTHSIFGYMSNWGTYTINSDRANFPTSLAFNSSASLSGSGTIRLNAADTYAQITVVGEHVLNMDRYSSIRGFGRIDGRVSLERHNATTSATIDADTPDEMLQLRIGNSTNAGALLATSGRLRIIDSSVSNASSGIIRADGGIVELVGSKITNGTLGGINSSNFSVIGPNDPKRFSRFTDTTIDGSVYVHTNGILKLVGTINNHGLLHVNPDEYNGGGRINVQFDSALKGEGVLRLNATPNSVQISTDPGASLTNEADHTIAGFGAITASLINQGAVTADRNGQALELLTEDVVNKNTLSVINGGILDIKGIEIDQIGGGHIAAIDGTVRYSAATIRGGELAGTSGEHLIAGPTTFDGVHAAHTVRVLTGQVLNISNSLINDDNLVVNRNNIGVSTGLNFLNDGELMGIGQIILDGTYTSAHLMANPGVTVTNESDHTIAGAGLIDPDHFINNGTVDASTSGRSLILASPLVENNGIMGASNNGTLELAYPGVITQSNNAQLLADDGIVALVGTDIIGGELNSNGAGYFNVLFDSTIDDATINGVVRIQPGVNLTLDYPYYNDGEIIIGNDDGLDPSTLSIVGGSFLSGTGRTILNGDIGESRIVTIGGNNNLGVVQGHTLMGSGYIDARLINSGTIEIGLPIGTIIAHELSMDTESTLKVDVAGPDNADLFVSENRVLLHDSTLDVSLVNGFDTTSPWTATILLADNVVGGVFGTINFPPPPSNPNLRYAIRYGLDEVSIGAFCIADINLSGDLDFLDISAFLGAFGNGEAAGDLNGDGQFDFLDISAFLGGYNNGCP